MKFFINIIIFIKLKYYKFIINYIELKFINKNNLFFKIELNRLIKLCKNKNNLNSSFTRHIAILHIQ